MAGYRDDLKGNVRSAFREANPDAFGKVSTAEATRQLGKIEQRKADIRQKLIEHCKRHEESWATKVASGMFERRIILANDILKREQDKTGEGEKNNPEKAEQNEKRKQIFLKEIKQEDLMQAARREVRARVNKRISRVNRIAKSMSNSVVRNSQNITPERLSNETPQQENRIKQKM